MYHSILTVSKICNIMVTVFMAAKTGSNFTWNYNNFLKAGHFLDYFFCNTHIVNLEMQTWFTYIFDFCSGLFLLGKLIDLMNITYILYRFIEFEFTNFSIVTNIKLCVNCIYRSQILPIGFLHGRKLASCSCLHFGFHCVAMAPTSTFAKLTGSSGKCTNLYFNSLFYSYGPMD